MLDVGCGWGCFAIYAAREYGVSVTGITLSEPQAKRARPRGGGGRRRSRRHPRHGLPGTARRAFDTIATIGMVEHVGSVQIDAYAQTSAGCWSPGGRLLNHGIARLRVGEPEAGPFSERYVFPDAAPLHLSRIRPRSSAPACQPSTSRASGWITPRRCALGAAARRQRRPGERLVGPERVRVWRLYLRAARHDFASGFTSVYQVRAAPPGVVLAPVGAESATVGV